MILALQEKNMNENDLVIERVKCFIDLDEEVQAAIKNLENDQTISTEDNKILKKRLQTVDNYVQNKSKGAFSVINMFKYLFIFHTYADKFNFPISY